MQFTHCHFIGCGGTGSYLANPLTKLLAYHPDGSNSITFYDEDVYENKNHERQVFSKNDVGKNKAVATSISISEGVPNAVSNAVPYYVTKHSMIDALKQYHFDDDFQLIVVAVDNETARNDIINAADEVAKTDNINFVIVLPGNGYDTATCLWYGRYNNTVFTTHPFDNAINWKHPTDKFVGSCQNEAVDSPQLITANFAAAFMSLLVVERLLNEVPIPYKLSYSSKDMSVKPIGTFI